MRTAFFRRVRPEQVRELFRSCRLIGRRFRLAHVRFGREIIEVATFRGVPQEEEDEEEDHQRVNGRIVRDNVYGTLEEDAWRRDFSVNCLYYDLSDSTVVDYTGGMADLGERELRMIGDAEVRYREDPVRMLRAIRFAAKLDFQIDQPILDDMHEHVDRIANVPAARLFDVA